MTSGFAFAVFADQCDTLTRMQMEVQIIQHQARTSLVAERNIAKFESVLDRPRRRQCVRLGLDCRLHREESQQIREEQRLVCNAGKRGENLLNVGAGLHDRAGEEGERTDAECSSDGPPNHINIRGVITGRADHGQK